MRRNNGAAGIDQTTLADVEKYGVARLLGELEAELTAGAYRPLPARRVFIPKPGSDERRPLSIPSVRDRIVQAAVGDRPCGEPGGGAHRTSNRPSTSTAASSGSSATPTVDRAWRPRSPSTATIRS